MNANGKQIGLDLLAWAARLQAIEDEQRRLLELDAHFSGLLLETLARTQIDGNTGPAPVFNLEAQGRVGLGSGFRIDALFVAITHDTLAIDDTGAVLSAHRIQDGDGWNGLPHFQLLAPHTLGLKAHRRFHGHKAQQLHHVILHHVAQRTSLLVERSSAFDAQCFRRGDLHVVDVIAVPDGLKNSVGKAEDQNVLHGLFAEVVVDAEDLALVEDGVDLMVEFAGRVKIVTERFFNDDRCSAFFRLRHALRAQVLDNAGEELGRRGEIEKPVAANAFLAVDSFQLGFQIPRNSQGRRSSAGNS